MVHSPSIHSLLVSLTSRCLSQSPSQSTRKRETRRGRVKKDSNKALCSMQCPYILLFCPPPCNNHLFLHYASSTPSEISAINAKSNINAINAIYAAATLNSHCLSCVCVCMCACASMWVCVRARMRACVRACVRACYPLPLLKKKVLLPSPTFTSSSSPVA